MERPVIRPARQSDLAAFHGIYGHYVRHGIGTFAETEPEFEDFAAPWRTLMDQGLPAFAAVDAADQAIGYAYAARYRDRSAYRFTLEDSVYLAPDWPGRGVGRDLLESVLDAAKGLGIRQMIAVVAVDPEAPPPASLHLHLACDFKEVGRLTQVGFKFGRWLDTLFLQCRLDEWRRCP